MVIRARILFSEKTGSIFAGSIKRGLAYIEQSPVENSLVCQFVIFYTRIGPGGKVADIDADRA